MSAKSNTFSTDSDRAKNKFMGGPSMSLWYTLTYRM